MANIQEVQPVTPVTQVARSARTKVRKEQPVIVKAYLVVYNIFSTLGWASVFILLVTHLATPYLTPEAHSDEFAPPNLIQKAIQYLLSLLPFTTPFAETPSYIDEKIPVELLPLWKRAATSYETIGELTKLVQSAAVLEVLHSAFGLVGSPVLTTLMQVSSRMTLVWGICDKFTTAQNNPLYTTMVLAWSITELIRYPFYAFSTIGKEPYALLYLRYTTFWVLYPVGAASEAFLMWSTLPWASKGFAIQEWGLWEVVRGALFVIWWPGLYTMYTYMIKQRKKTLGATGKKTIKTQ